MQDESLISREASAAIKGLLIFLIILGHNSFFSTKMSIGMVYLYTFHIQSFFMLPFLYPHKQISLSRIKGYLIRFYYPFVLFFVFLSLINYAGNLIGLIPENECEFIIDPSDRWKEFFLTILTGNGDGIDYFTGSQYLWFLPVIFSMTILKDIYYSTNTPIFIRWGLVLFGSAFFIIYFIFGFRSIFDRQVIYLLKEYSPFAVTHALGAFFMGIVMLKVIKLDKFRLSDIVIPILFIVGTIFCFSSQPAGDVPIEDMRRWILLLTMPFLFFYIIYRYRDFISRSGILKELGKYSFPIYIIHPLLLHFSFMVIYPKFGTNWWLIIVSQVVITLISYCIARLIFKNRILKAVLFPSNWSEISSLK